MQTKFWLDKWWKGNKRWIEEFPPTNMNVNINASVADFCLENGGWDWNKLSETLPQQAPNTFFSLIPADRSGDSDKIFWLPDKTGIFSVKSAYSSIAKSDWNMTDPLWKWKGPERVRIFLWRLIHNAFPSRQRPNRCIGGSACCEWCPGEVKSLIHVTRDCRYARQIWQNLVDRKYWSSFFSCDLHVWVRRNLSSNFGKNSLDWNTLWAVSCWSLWKWRCSALFDNASTRPYHPVEAIKRTVDLFSVDNPSNTHDRQKPERNEAWSMPPHGWYKVNTDGTSKANQEIASCGAIIRDEEGDWVAGMTRNLGGGSALCAELWGVYEGLLLAWDMGCRKVILESDSEIIINNLRNGKEVYGDSSSLWYKIGELIKFDWTILFSHVRRNGNSCADKLANKSINGELGVTILATCPEDLWSVLLSDPLGVNIPHPQVD